MNSYFIIILSAIILHYVLDTLSDALNLQHITTHLPTEFEDSYDPARYLRSQDYLRACTRFGLFSDAIHTTAILAFILLGGFAAVDGLARAVARGEILQGLAFAGILVLASQLLSLPFSIYRTFKIEESFGFNKTTPRTFVLDLFKGLLLTALIGGAIFAAVIWLFLATGELAWLYCWTAISTFQIFLLFISPYVIMPLFNTFTPMEDGELRTALETYARKQNFHMQGIFTMDGSRRSSKSNAFFTGFGKSRRIVLLDTLIEKHSIDELLAVVAHEMGHYKCHHIPKAIVRSLLLSGVMFFVLGQFIRNPGLFAAFRIPPEHVSVYASLVFFGFLFAPINLALSVVEHAISRKHEYEADAFAGRTTKKPQAMINALKKLTVDNLGNLTPHPFKVWLSYSHPPVLQRISAIRKADTEQQQT
ncbi:MAG: M48 family metallopeptidase [Kiritimatiellae bacterium]|nr:M48 family metallopeptidase [Kiritimatiellia bacterium]